MEPIYAAQRRSRSNCECLLVALVLYSLVPGNASAGDQPPQGAEAQIAAPSFPARFALSAPRAVMPAFSETEFRARKQGLLEAADAGSEGAVIDAPMLRDTSIARELSEAKTQDRVRLLTLWQSRASSLSLQAGKRGAPSLQWSTPWMHRDAARRGLFDRLIPAAPRSFGSSAIRGGAASRQAGAIGPAKTLDLGTLINNK